MALVPPPAARPAGSSGHSLVVPVTALVAILLLSWFSIATKPTQALVETWWPASGIAIGAALRLPKRDLWWFSLVAGLVVLGANFAQFHNIGMSIAASVGASVEIWVGVQILRWRSEKEPTLATRADLGRLLVAAVLAATAFDLILSAAALATSGTAEAIFHLASAGPRRAAGILLITPLFLRLPEDHLGKMDGRAVTHIATGLVTAGLVFLTPQHLPLAFLPLVPPIAGALVIPARWLMVEMIGIATIASYGSSIGNGPFSFTVLGSDGGAAILQVFEVAMVGLALLLALTADAERDVARLLTASELLYRRSFQNSVSGMLIANREESRWTVQTANPAAAQLLPEVRPGESDVAALLGQAAVSALNAAGDATVAEPTELELSDGRHLTASITPLSDEPPVGSASIQLIDITDSLIAQRLMEADLERAQQVQRALSPHTLPIRRGWEHAATATTAREVGGDFYDLRISGSSAAVILGDVMGKGMGAGILAAATRTALRAAEVPAHPSEALADSARIIEEDLTSAGAFVTVGYATVDLVTGRVRLVDAGHGLSFALRDSGEVERLATFDLPLGVESEWQELESHLDPGEGLLMVSDGVLELWGTTIEELADAIGRLNQRYLDKAPDILVEALCAGPHSTSERTDDATAVLLRRERQA